MKKECTKCKQGIMVWDELVRISNPPKYQHECDNCKHIEYYDNALFALNDKSINI